MANGPAGLNANRIYVWRLAVIRVGSLMQLPRRVMHSNGADYSQRSAASGSTFVARRAGT